MAALLGGIVEFLFAQHVVVGGAVGEVIGCGVVFDERADECEWFAGVGGDPGETGVFAHELVKIFGGPVVGGYGREDACPGFEAVSLCPARRSGVLAPFAGQ